jgi:ABC-type uncharacterized transport system substrate-binding protein
MTALPLLITPRLPLPQPRTRPVCEPCQHRLAGVASNYASAFAGLALYRSTRPPEPAGHQAGGSAGGKAYEVQTGHQPQNRPGTWDHDSSKRPFPGGPGDPMTALALIVALTLSLLVAPFTSQAQGPTKVYHIGLLRAGSAPAGADPTVEAFRQGMRDLGYLEGQHFVVESRWAEGKEENLHDLAAELVRRKVDVLMTRGAAAIRAAQQATRTIPIVMIGVYDPVDAGFVASLGRPGGNITGLSGLGLDLAGKRLEILKETVPQLSHVAVLENPATSPHKAFLESLTVVSRTLGLQLQAFEVRSPDELDQAFAALIREGAEALCILPDPLMLDRLRGRIADLTAQHRLPAIYPFKSYVDAGGLMSYTPSDDALSRRAAYYVDRILKGTKPADLPVEQPTKFEFVINLKAAKALGLTIPPTVLFQADEVLQ